jgi:hypothetical protein
MSLTDEERQQLMRRVEHAHKMFPCCINCDNFVEEIEICKLYQIRPPAHIIAYGCPAWLQLVPF